jgi:hypothetical protein
MHPFESVYLLVPVFLFEHAPSNRTDAKISQAINATFQRPGDYEPRVSLYNNNARNIASFRNFAQKAALRRRDFNQTAVFSDSFLNAFAKAKRVGITSFEHEGGRNGKGPV